MAEFILEFEKPVAELQKKIAELQALSASGGVDVSSEIAALREKLDATVRNIHESLTPWQRVQLARHPERPYPLDYIENMMTDFLEFHGDRRFRDDKAMVGGIGRFRGIPVMVIGTQKGRDTKSNLYRNFGWPHPEGYRKARRLMQMADRMGLPVITMIDTPGAFPGIASEERHVGEAIAVNLRDMFTLTVPVVAAVIGEGGSGGALGIGVGNRILIMENAYYSVITPEGCAAILWKDRKFAPQAAEALKLTAADLLRLKVADRVVPEPPGGAHRDHLRAAEILSDAIAEELEVLMKMSPEELKQQRYEKFRAVGEVCERARNIKKPSAPPAEEKVSHAE